MRFCRPIKRGDEISITYGPSKFLSYDKRQERLNHYLFACRCSLCLDDARKVSNLRCRSCSGPVVIDSTIKLEPSLYGKCPICYEKYDNIEEAIDQLNNAKRFIESSFRVAILLPDRLKLLQRMIEKTKQVIDLSLCTSGNNLRYIQLCFYFVQMMADKIDQVYSLQD